MPNTAKIKGRMKTITSTQKITKAMKLVSLSKLQQYKRRMASFDVYFDALQKNNEKFIGFSQSDQDLASVYLIFMPDLGLCSSYTNGMNRFVHENLKEDDVAILVGTQHYDLLQKQGINILNPMISSEKFEIEDALEYLKDMQETHHICALLPDYQGLNLVFEKVQLQTKAVQLRDDVIFEPNFKEASQRLISVSVIAMVQNTYFQSKVAEHTTRRIAMEKATDSAQDMLDELLRLYNKARQEAITQEIAEIVSGMEAN